MAQAVDVVGNVFKNATVTMLARIVGADAANVQQADIASGVYSVYLIDQDDPDTLTVVTGHDEVAIVVADTIFDSLQTDAIWTVDSTGYNFRHILDVSSNQAFAIADRDYLTEFSLTPTSGQIIPVRFRLTSK